jgi:hypothetical protein
MNAHDDRAGRRLQGAETQRKVSSKDESGKDKDGIVQRGKGAFFGADYAWLIRPPASVKV